MPATGVGPPVTPGPTEASMTTNNGCLGWILETFVATLLVVLGVIIGLFVFCDNDSEPSSRERIEAPSTTNNPNASWTGTAQEAQISIREGTAPNRTLIRMRVVCHPDGQPRLSLIMAHLLILGGIEAQNTTVFMWASGTRSTARGEFRSTPGVGGVTFSAADTRRLLPKLMAESFVRTRATDSAPGNSQRWSLTGSRAAIRGLACTP